MIASFTVAITSFDRRQIRHDRPIDRDTFGRGGSDHCGHRYRRGDRECSGSSLGAPVSSYGQCYQVSAVDKYCQFLRYFLEFFGLKNAFLGESTPPFAHRNFPLDERLFPYGLTLKKARDNLNSFENRTVLSFI